MAAVIAPPQKCWRLLLVMLPKQEGSADDVAPRAPRKGAGVRLRIWQEHQSAYGRDRAQRRLSVDRPHYPDGGAGLPFSGRHRHVFQEEILIVMGRQGTLLHNDEHIAVASGDCFCYRP